MVTELFNNGVIKVTLTDSLVIESFNLATGEKMGSGVFGVVNDKMLRAGIGALMISDFGIIQEVLQKVANITQKHILQVVAKPDC